MSSKRTDSTFYSLVTSNRVVQENVINELISMPIIEHSVYRNGNTYTHINHESNHSFEQQLNSTLSTFEGYGLADLQKANLMSRVDSKFLLPIHLLPQILSQLGQHYRVLDINGKRKSTYFNQYFDTQDMGLYKDHHNGRLKRFKVRQRSYVDTDTKFLEVKCKSNQKRTVKNRINLCDSTEENKEQFLHEQMAENYAKFHISQQGGYQRIALANEASAERLTLDFGLWFETPEKDKKISLPSFFIAELKQNKHSKNSPFYKLMSAKQIAPTSFSKYCMGCALLYKQHLKTNAFKATLNKIERFQNAFEQVFKSSFTH